MKKRWLTFLVLLFTLFPNPILGRIQAAPPPPDQPASTAPLESQAVFTVYLPLAIGGSGPINGGNSEGALWLPYTLTEDSVIPTYGTSVAVDANGGIHTAYAIYTGTNPQGLQPATYAFCASGCHLLENWTYTYLGDAVQDVRLALDPVGRPRLMLFGPVPDPVWPRMQYQYAECNNACTNQANWTLTTIATPIEATGTRESNNNRYFALDGSGRPAFIYTDTIQNNHPGTFYVSCQANCTNANQWGETTLTSNTVYDKPSLVFSPDGLPRVVFGFFDADDNLFLAYAQCDVNCADWANWSGTLLSQIHGSAMFNLQVDSGGQPRLAVYSGSYGYAPFQNQRLYYLWCDTGCAVDAGNWYFTDVNMPAGSGDGVDLVLDTLDRPRMSFQIAGDALGYAWCDTDCESGSGVWQYRVVESQEDLADDFEVLPVQRCTVSTWFNGQRTSLALDPNGNPRFGYDAQHWWFGTQIVNGTPQPCNYQDATVTRFALIDQP